MNIKKLPILFFLFLMACNTLYSQDRKISVQIQQQTLQEIFDILESETNYRFFYSDNFLALQQKTDLEIYNGTIEQALNKLFDMTDLGYRIMDNNMIVITYKDNFERMNISGYVTNESGKPLQGVTVKVKDTTKGTYTDEMGYFKLENIVGSYSTLVFSFVGMTTQEILLNGRNIINAILKEEPIGLNDVIVIGYGSQLKKDITGSVISIKGQRLLETASFSPSQALQGIAAGLVVQETNAKPGEAPLITLRGSRSLEATNEPLYVVDGVPLVSGYEDIPKSNIASIGLLKDASATAIYGSRGANGVILITTKKGSPDHTLIELNSYFGIQKPAKFVKTFNAAEWVDLIREAYRTSGVYPESPSWEMDQIMMPVAQDNDPFGIAYKIRNAYDENGKWHPERLKTVNWYDEILRTGIITDQELSVRGGSEKINAYVAANYFYNKGLVIGQDYSRTSARINFEWNINKRLKLEGYSSYTISLRNDGANLFEMVQTISPLANIRSADGELIKRPGNDTQLWNPVLNITEYIQKYRKERFLGSYFLEIQLPYKIRFRSNFGIDIGPSFVQGFYGSLSSDRQGGYPRATNSGNDSFMYTWENLIYWNKNTGNHIFGLTLLQSIQQNKSESYEISVQNLTYSNNLWYNMGNTSMITDIDSRFYKWQIASYMGRLNYTFKDRYLFTASARYDGSSCLATGHKWVLFPSVALAWHINEEEFMNNLPFVDNLKIRLGYGITGNSAVDPYKTEGSLDYGRYNFGNINVMAFFQDELPNPDLTWEKTKQWNAGIDFSICKSRVSGVIDLYLQNTYDLLMNRQLPNVSGFNSVLYNIGKTRNKGIEVTFNTINLKKRNLEWTSDLIFGTNKEEIVELFGGKNDDPGNNWFIGQPLNVFFDYKYLGIWQLDEQEEALKYGTSFKPGTIKVLDKDDNYQITAEDRVIIGSTVPKFVSSLANKLIYKNLDITLFFNSSFGNMLRFNGGLRYNGRYNGIKTNYWRITEYEDSGNPIASNESNEAPRPDSGVEVFPYVSSLSYYNASFIRLNNFSIGYNIPSKSLKKIHLSTLRLYISLQNVFCITKYPGTDPESGSNFNVPNPRTTLFGINVSI